MRPFEPILRNPHALTIAGNFWPRNHDFTPFPNQRRLVQTDPETQVLVDTHHLAKPAIGHVILLHGLEGSAESGYNISMAWDALNVGFIAHRFHMRTCGGTAHLCKTLYHAGLTADLRAFVQQLRAGPEPESTLPIFLIGFSLGGNVALKLAGEEGNSNLIQGVCAVSTPIDLAAATKRMQHLDNRIYERRFVNRMKERLLETGRYTKADLKGCDSIWTIDDRITAPSFNFGTAANYYDTQSAKNFLDAIRIPTLLIQAKDDTFIPFEMYSHPAFGRNTNLHLIATDHGGHLGFLSRHSPRFWLDGVVLEFIAANLPTPAAMGRNIRCGD